MFICMADSGDLVPDAILFLLLAFAGFFIVRLFDKDKALPFPFSKRKPRPHELLSGAAILALLHLLYANNNAAGFAWNTLQGIISGDARNSGVMARYATTDEAYRSFATNGNVYVRFVNFDVARPMDKDFTDFQHVRSVYAIYPRRVYFGDDKDVILVGGDAMRTGFSPSEQWLDAHKVATLVTWRVGENGDLIQDVSTRDIKPGLQREEPLNSQNPPLSVPAILQVVLWVVLVLMLGYATLSLIYAGERRGLGETLGLSLALGAGNMGLLLFYSSLAGFAPSRKVLVCIGALVTALLLLRWRKKRLLRIQMALPQFTSKTPAHLLPVAFVAYLSFAVAFHAMALPLYEWDAFAIFGLKAKMLLLQSLRANAGFFHDAQFQFSHPDYPLLLPFLMSGCWAAIGHVDDALGKIMMPLMYAGFAIIAFLALRWKLTRNRALLLTAILLAIPTCVRWAGSGQGDMPLTVFYAGSVYFLTRWVTEDKRSDLILAALFTVYAAFTKGEGIPLAGINIVVLFCSIVFRTTRRRLFEGAGFVGGIVILLLPWFWFSHGFPATHETSISKAITNLSNLWIVVPEFIRQPVEFQRWGAVWLLLILSAILGWKGFRSPAVVLLWLLLVAHVALYVVVYLVTDYGVKGLMDYTLDRTLLHTTPAAVYLIGYHWACIPGRNEHTA